MPERATCRSLIEIVVPGEPPPYRERTRTYTRRVPGKKGQPIGSLAVGSYQSKKSERYQDSISRVARLSMAFNDPYEGPVRLNVRAFMAIPKRTTRKNLALMKSGVLLPCRTPDYTNITKLAEDALSKIVFKDDKQVNGPGDRCGRFYSHNPRLEVDVMIVEGPCPMQVAELAYEVRQDRSEPTRKRS